MHFPFSFAKLKVSFRLFPKIQDWKYKKVDIKQIKFQIYLLYNIELANRGYKLQQKGSVLDFKLY